MSKAKVLRDQSLDFADGTFEAQVKVYEVAKSLKFPDGFKVRCALIETKTGALRVLLDNHEPFGYHLHAKLPKDRKARTSVNVRNYQDAISLFFDEVEKVVKNEK
jgi:hypothetical protein